MKIGITCYPTYGGSGIVATELGLELALRGHEVHFITYANPIRLDPDTPNIHYHEVEVTSYPLFQHPPYTLALASRMAEVAERQGLDLLHVHYAIPHSISALLAREMAAARRRLPFITTLHGTDITLVGMEPSYFPITRFSIDRSDGVTAISNYLAAETRRVFGVERDIRVIPNFVNCSLYHPQPERREKTKTLLHISNFRPVKRIVDCIEVLARVRRHVEAQLWMAGDGPERGAAEQRAADLGLTPYVEFLGKQDHIERLIPRAHVLLLPSQLESFGLAALEAMACGVAPVATNTGGLPELVKPGWNGFLENPGDVDAQAARAVELLSNEARYAQVSAAARQTAEEHFCSSLLIPQYIRYYEEVLGR